MAKLRLFAALREAAGVAEARIEAETAAELVENARRMFGSSFSDQVARAAIVLNGEEVSRGQLSELALGPDDEVCLLPPVSGGS